MHAPVRRVLPLRLVPLGDDAFPLGVRQKTKVADGPVGPLRHPFEETPKMTHHPPRPFVVEDPSIVLEAQLELRLTIRGQAYAKARLPPVLEAPARPIALQLANSRVDDGPIEAHRGLEEGRARRHVASRLHQVEGRVLVGADLHLGLPQGPQPGRQRLVAIHAHANGEGVDEKADHVLGPFHGRPPERARRAEDHHGLPAVVVEQQRPRPLQERIQGDALLARERLEPRGRGHGQ